MCMFLIYLLLEETLLHSENCFLWGKQLGLYYFFKLVEYNVLLHLILLDFDFTVLFCFISLWFSASFERFLMG